MRKLVFHNNFVTRRPPPRATPLRPPRCRGNLQPVGRLKKRSPPKKRTGFALVAVNPSTARAAHKAAVAAADKARRAQRVTAARARYGGPDAQGPPVAGSVAVLGERERNRVPALRAAGLIKRKQLRCFTAVKRRCLACSTTCLMELAVRRGGRVFCL